MAGDDDVTIRVRADNQTGPGFAAVRAGLASLTKASAGTAAGFGALAPQVAGVAAALAQLAPAAGVAATGTLAAASAGAALKIGMSGVGDAVKAALDPSDPKKFAEAMKALSPNARSFVQEIKEAAPAFGRLKRSVQDKLFEGLDKTLTRTGRATLPALKKSVQDSATTLNFMAKGVGAAATSLGQSGVLGKALGSANKGMRNLVGIPATLVQGLVQVGAAAGPSFERMTKAAGTGVDRLSDKMTKAFKSGAMQDSIETAVDLAKQLGQGLGNVGKVLANIGRAADQSGAGLIGTFKTLTGELAKITATKGVQDGLRTLFQTMGTIGRTGAQLLGEAVKGLAPVITALGPPVQALVKNLGAGLTSAMRSLSPILIDAATSFGRIVTAVSPLTAVIGGLVAAGLDALAPLLREVGEQAALFAESASSLLGPALKALPALVGPLMSLFGELAALWVGIQNDVLKAMQPSLSRLGEAFGRIASSVAPLVPLFTDFVEFGLRGVGSVASAGARALGRLADAITTRVAPALEAMGKWAGGHKLEIMQLFNAGKDAAYGFAIAVGESLPTVFGLFKALGTIVLDSLGAIVNGAVTAFGWIPGIGPKIKDAAKGFNAFSDLAKKGMDKAGKELNEFVAGALPKLKNNRLRMNISNWSDQIAEAKRQLSDKNLPPSKRAKLLADIKQWQDNIARAKRTIGGVKGAARKLTVSSNAAAVAGAARGAINSVRSRTVTITTHYRITGSRGGPPSGTYYGSTAGRSADGNIYRAFANGSERHVAEIAQPTMRVWAEPETGGEAYIPLSPAKRGRSVAILEEVADRFGYGLEKFAKGGLSKAAKAEREARRGLVGDLTISRFGQAAGYRRSELRSALARPSDVGSLVDTLNRWRSNIAKATHGGTERRLMRALDTAGKSLLRNAKAHDKVSAELDRAKGKLSDLRSSFNQLRDSVASGIRGSANITQLANDNGRVTVGGIMSKLTGVRDQSKAFAGALSTLKKRGVKGSILADIGSAGLEGGGLDTATALLGASKSDIAAMNKLQGQIASNAKAAGTATATAMYGAGIKTAEGLVKGLEKQKKKLEGVMDDVAKSFARSLKRALGIKGKASGGVSGGGLTAVGERGWELLDLPAGSRVRPHGDSRRMAAGWSGGGQPIIIHQTITLDGRVVARQIFDPLRNEIRNRSGGNVQLALGRGTG